MILPVHTQLRDRIAAALASLYDLDREAMPTIVLEYPPNRRLGDLAVTVAFELARTLHKAPRVIAREIADSIGDLGDIGRVEPTSAGYLNVFLNRTVFARIRLTDGGGSTEQKNAPKTIVEHTAINPNISMTPGSKSPTSWSVSVSLRTPGSMASAYSLMHPDLTPTAGTSTPG
jgi:arginyl-tRNA synthetase